MNRSKVMTTLQLAAHVRLPVAVAAVWLLTAAGAPAGVAGILVSEDFTGDPVSGGAAMIAGDAGRFAFAPGGITAHYDSGLPTAKMLWPLGVALDETTDFEIRVEMEIQSQGFYASPSAFAQIAFGGQHSLNTGDDRAGGTGGDAFDIVTFDYFPNVSPVFGGPSLSPTAVLSDNGTGFFNRIRFLSGTETALDDEGPLPLDASLTAELTYEAATRLLTLRMSGPGGPLDINSLGEAFLPGGLDGDDATIQNVLDPGDTFSLDTFGLLLWQDTFGGGSSTVVADVVFRDILVTAPGLMPLAGDVNADGVVDMADVAVVSAHFLQQPATLIEGDADGNGRVDGLDVNLISAQMAGGGGPLTVPEPCGWLLGFLAAIIWSWMTAGRRRRLHCHGDVR